LGAESVTRVKAWAELAIRNDPLNARAFGILAQISDTGTDKDQTRRLMQAAERRSLHETLAVFWMMLVSYQNEDYHAALSYADVLLRTSPGLFSAAMPILGSIAEAKNPELKQLLATNPPWRPEFLHLLPAYITDARTPLEILLSLKDSRTPPTAADLESYLDFLVRHSFYDLAYYTWLQFLPAEQFSKAGRLFNGSFEGEPSGQPFDWVLSKGAGYTTKIAARRDANGARALFIQLGPGRIDFGGVQQLIILPPGNYRLEGQYKSDLVSDRGLYWQIVCANSKKTIGESEPFNGTSPDWKDFVVSFAVPDTDCPAQYVTLVSGARSASEQFLSGTVWYGDLRIDEGAREAAHDLPAR
jgi:hypothetical protein